MHVYKSVSIIAFLLLFLNPFRGGCQIYVATGGADTNTGSHEKPLATVAMALRKVRELRRLNDSSVKNGIHIIVD
ncbi:MAG TPA: hypothetical protein VNS32_12225, partial [Flavisolibacter sp.]|nr:hypothetical protein [Flavisolibacter sp.]